MTAAQTLEATAYTACVTTDPELVERAQRLRYRVFGLEQGARLAGGTDRDEYDGRAEHVIVRHTSSGAVVGTYRLLSGDAPRYGATEFDLCALAGLQGSLVEAGRSCVDPAHRDGAVIMLLWSTMARHVLAGGYQYLAGCASVPLANGGQQAATLQALTPRHQAPAELTVRPHRPWTPTELHDRPRYADLPPLVRAYLRLGAWVCGPPAVDEQFGVADFYLLLRLDRLNERYRRYFLGEPSEQGAK